MTTVNWKRLSWWVGGLVLVAALATPNLGEGKHTANAGAQDPVDIRVEEEVSDHDSTAMLSEAAFD